MNLMENTKLMDKIQELPENLHEEVYDFINYLLTKHKKENRLALTSKERLQLELTLGIKKSQTEKQVFNT